MLLIRGIYLLLSHSPTSHTTVRAVPHTAVPILDAIRDNYPSAWYTLPFSDSHLIGLVSKSGCRLYANYQDVCSPIDRLAGRLCHIVWGWLSSSWVSSMLSIYTFVSVALTIHRFQGKAVLSEQDDSTLSNPVCTLSASVSCVHSPNHYCDSSTLWAWLSSWFWFWGVQQADICLCLHKRSSRGI